MSDVEFWDRVRHGAEKLQIPGTTFRAWKSRGRVSREKIIDLYQVLAGTEHEVSLDQLNNKH
jgi:hypothetical protein